MGSGGGAPTKQEVTSTNTTTNLPSYVQPYFTNLLERTQDVAFEPFVKYERDRIAGFTPEQQQVQQNVMNLQQPGEMDAASQLAGIGGLGSLFASQYNPTQFSSQDVRMPRLQNYSMQAPDDVYGQNYNAPQMATARTGFNPNLQDYQMEAPDQFGQSQVDRYMSPYMQNVVDATKREAITDAQKAQLMTNLGAARQGTYGGARQLLAGTERERALKQNLSDIQSKGSQAAYENAQQQFERDRAAGMTAGQQNLQARLQTQQLRTQTGLQTALANLSSEQQANVQNQAAQLQTQGLNADQALRAALANQQTRLNVGQQNLQSRLQTQQLGTQTGLQAALANQQAGLERQRMTEASRQFGSTLGLQGLAQAMQGAQTLGQLGQTRQQMDLQRLQAQDLTAAQKQQLQQRYLDTRYQDFLAQRQYPMDQLSYYSSILHGIPVTPNTSSTVSQPAPSQLGQMANLGIGALGLSKLMG
jgi:hypothetical protein